MELDDSTLDVLKCIDDSIKAKKYVAYRTVNPKVNESNYYISSKVDFKEIPVTNEFKNIHHLWETLKSKGKFHRSSSGSQYITNENEIYRLSDHWGGCASCFWTIEGEGDPNFRRSVPEGPLRIGFAKIEDFEAYEVTFKKDNILDINWINEFMNLFNNTIDMLKQKYNEEQEVSENKILVSRYISTLNKLNREVSQNLARL